jgi:hypothetical protein
MRKGHIDTDTKTNVNTNARTNGNTDADVAARCYP